MRSRLISIVARSGRARRLTGLGLALVAAAILAPRPVAAGDLPGCCICQECADPPATQCFEAPADCLDLCASLNCASASDTSVSCGQQPPCSSFSAPAPAPALAPFGLGLAGLLLAGVGRRALGRLR